jgi:hypothetical protein
LGENVAGLKTLVHQVYKNIQHKVDRDDIRKLISSRLAQMEKEIVQREEELYSMTSTTRCLSCGQMPKESWQAANMFSPNSRASGTRSVTEGGGERPPFVIPPNVSFPPGLRPLMDDESSEGSSYWHHHHQQYHGGPSSSSKSTIVTTSDAMNPHSLANNEQIYALLTGQAGLKPLQLHHAPMIPQTPGTATAASSAAASRPHTTSANPVAATNKTKKNNAGEKIPDSSYRKSKLSQHVREMVKVSAPAAEQYGYNPSNPMYVLEGGVMDDDNASIGSLGSIGSSRQLMGSHSLPTGLHPSTAGRDQKTIKVGGAGGKNNTKNNITINFMSKSSTHHQQQQNDSHLVLPDIHNSSKPGSPNGSNRQRKSPSGVQEDSPQMMISQVKMSSYL